MSAGSATTTAHGTRDDDLDVRVDGDLLWIGPVSATDHPPSRLSLVERHADVLKL